MFYNLLVAVSFSNTYPHLSSIHPPLLSSPPSRIPITIISSDVKHTRTRIRTREIVSPKSYNLVTGQYSRVPCSNIVVLPPSSFKPCGHLETIRDEGSWKATGRLIRACVTPLFLSEQGPIRILAFAEESSKRQHASTRARQVQRVSKEREPSNEIKENDKEKEGCGGNSRGGLRASKRSGEGDSAWNSS